MPWFRFKRGSSMVMLSVGILAIILLMGFFFSTHFGSAGLVEDELLVSDLRPEIRDGITPRPCIGFQPKVGKWGYETGLCPANYVFMANNIIEGGYVEGPGEFVMIDGLCCPLPAEDILTARHSYSELESCPDQSVATGGAGECRESCTMRCTQINTEKYRLGPERASYQVGFSRSKPFFGSSGVRLIAWDRLPESIRFGVLRSSHSHWNAQGCLGAPIGSMLTRKSGKKCDSFYYRELQYLDGTPVQVLPDCPAVADPYDPNPHCLAEREKHLAREAIVNIK